MPSGPALTLPARLLLLAYDPGKDRVTGAPDLPLALRAAALVELAARGLVQEVDGVVTPVLGARTGDAVLDQLLELIEESRPRRWRRLITHHARATHDLARRGLVTDGLLRRERGRVLGVLPVTRYRLRRPGYVEAQRAGLLSVLTSPAPAADVPPEDATLLVLAASGHLRSLIPTRTRRLHATRLSALSVRAGPHVPPIARALEAAVKSAEAARSSGGG
ncbi:GPP34 family phosphoprotein [Streptomyces sp. NPDC050095]|uniref:GOLPH3/VPS74 family protein n=1 Tax=unclassified Streptomyces TaxID=2593676 RepID=UPI003413BF8C